jgi:beta-xylosidase
MKKIYNNCLVRVLLLNTFLLCFLTTAIGQANSRKDFYMNPILGGDYPDPSVVRVGKDYYMTHSSFEYYPGLLIWHSTDLVHWERLTYALQKNVGSVWAPDLIKYKDSFYIYFPAGRKIWVVTAQSPAGPWSEPIDMNLQVFIDPGHVVDKDGTRYLYLSNGNLVQLTPDGLSTVSAPEPGYKGWQFPATWSTECFCLESPKSTVKDGFFYQTVAEGGTAGPATSHMVVSGRSTSPHGPWENSPYNPIIHTQSRNERWWSQGHGTLVDDINGNWWIMYHSYEKYFQTLGRQTLLLPIEWTKDHWFRVPNHIIAGNTIRKPAGSSNIPPDDLSDDFSKDKIGLQWQSFKHFPSESISLKNDALEWEAKGNSFEDGPPLLVNAGDRKYEVQVEYSIDEKTTAGLTLFYNEQGNMRVEVNAGQFAVYNQKNRKISIKNEIGNHGYLKILNDENEISFYYSPDSKTWKKIERSIDATGFNHNIFGGFMSLRAGIFVFGKGKVVFDNFKYKKLTN